MSASVALGSPEIGGKPVQSTDDEVRLTMRALSAVRVIDANDPRSVLADVQPGMLVIGSSCAKLGRVANVLTDDDDAPVAITVSYGVLARKRKMVPGVLVDLVDDDRVVLAIDQNQFKTLRDLAE